MSKQQPPELNRRLNEIAQGTLIMLLKSIEDNSLPPLLKPIFPLLAQKLPDYLATAISGLPEDKILAKISYIETELIPWLRESQSAPTIESL